MCVSPCISCPLKTSEEGDVKGYETIYNLFDVWGNVARHLSGLPAQTFLDMSVKETVFTSGRGREGSRRDGGDAGGTRECLIFT